MAVMEADKRHSPDSDGSAERGAPDDKPTTGSAESQPSLLEYVCHPAKRDMRITYLVILAIAICIIVVYLASFSPLLTVLAGLILFGSLAAFFFPTRYFFYDDHLAVKTTLQTLRKEWSLYRSYYPDKNGVLLSPFARQTRMENFRGLYIKFSGNRDEVMAIVRSKIDFEQES